MALTYTVTMYNRQGTAVNRKTFQTLQAAQDYKAEKDDGGEYGSVVISTPTPASDDTQFLVNSSPGRDFSLEELAQFESYEFQNLGPYVVEIGFYVPGARRGYLPLLKLLPGEVGKYHFSGSLVGTGTGSGTGSNPKLSSIHVRLQALGGGSSYVIRRPLY